jgi:predicted HNH restriction endonuclease
LQSDEVAVPLQYFEGTTRPITVNAYERNQQARQKCLEHHGCCCCACGFNFEKVYGELGRNFIHVHHLKPLSEIRQQYKIDPIADLCPICPNCHAMIHNGGKMMRIEDLRRLIQSHAK